MKVRGKVSIYLVTAVLILGGMSQLSIRRVGAFANTVGGGANGARVQASITGLVPVNIVSVAAVALPPEGGTLSNDVLTVPLNPVLSTGVIVNQTTGQTGFPTTASSTSTVDGLNVLGLVTAGTIRARANSTCNGVTASSNGNGSTVENLIVLGQPISVQPAPNTNIAVVNVPINIGGLTGVLLNGNIRLNEQLPTGNGSSTSGLTVNQIHVTLNGVLNVLGFQVPVLTADVIVAQAQSSVSCMPNANPTIAAAPSPPNPVAGTIVRQQGSPATSATIAVVSDPNEPAGNLTVTAAAPAGIIITGIVNNNGTVTADVAAASNATLGPNTVVLTATDGNGGSSTANLTVNVTPNTAPLLGNYPNASVNFGAGTTVTPSAAPSDNGTVVSVTAAAPGFTGTLTGNPATGVITVANAAPVGVFTVTVTATDNGGATSTKTFQLTVNNSGPTITASGSGVTVQQGSPAVVGATIATVSDPNEPAGNLTVTATPPAGITVTGIVNNNGTVRANIAAACNAVTGPNTVVLTVTDGNGGTATSSLTVTVAANTAPVLGNYSNASVNFGVGTTVTPSAAPVDNGTVVSLTAAAPGFTGTLTGNAGTGVITVVSAGPVGTFTVTVTATDGCGATSTRTFQLTVSNGSPTIAASGSGVTVQQGSPAVVGATIATVSDPNEPAGNLTVTATPPAGITVTGIVNNNGTVTANIAADGNSTVGPNTVVLMVTDGNGGSSTANLTVNVTPNTPPVLGDYPNTSLRPGGSTVVIPTAAPADNGSVVSVTASFNPNNFVGSVFVSPATGEVTINNANPSGIYTVTVTATDNLGATSSKVFQLLVNSCPAVDVSGGTTRTVVAEQTLSIAISATDPDGDTVSIVVANLPANATFSPNPAVGAPTATGTLTFTPSISQANQIFKVNVVASDNNGCNTAAAVPLEVIITVIPNQELCPQVITPGGECYTADLNSGTIGVTAGTSCNWTATTDTPWITITGGSNGAGNGAITYTVQQNLNPAPRSGTIRINNQTFKVLQGRYFDDVSPEAEFYPVINKIAAKGLTIGCTPSLYCPDDKTTRGQMTAFIIREIVGFTPPPSSTRSFADVEPGYVFYEYIETAYALGIIEPAGVNAEGQLLFKPEDPVVREHTVTWLIRSLGEFNPPAPAQPRFADVPTTHPNYAFVERAAELGITVGCGINAQGQRIFCTGGTTIRGQMAAFLIRTYGCP